MAITVTEKAATEVKRVMDEMKFAESEYALRVGVGAGGCSGFSYKLDFAKVSELDPLNDTIYEFHGVKAVVDNRSDMYLDGTIVDFHEGIEKRGFAFDNPNAKRGCGCGQSFSAG